MLTTYLLQFCRISACLVFAYSFISKLFNIPSFKQTLTQLVPHIWIETALFIVLASELSVAIAFIVAGNLLKVVFLAAMGMLVIFSIVLAVALRRNLRLECNCFGPRGKQISVYDILRNLVLVLCCLGGFWATQTASQDLTYVENFLVGLASAAAVVLVTNLPSLGEALQ